LECAKTLKARAIRSQALTCQLAGALFAPHAAGAPTTEARPNILLIISEDNGPQLRCYGDPHVKAPNLDKLASQGYRLYREETPNIPRSLKAAGYRTGKTGKLHSNYPDAHDPFLKPGDGLPKNPLTGQEVASLPRSPAAEKPAKKNRKKQQTE